MTSTTDSRPFYRRPPSRPVLTVIGALLLALLVLLILFEWNWLKRPLERMIEARTGRAFVIGGDLEVDLGRVTTVGGDRLSLANADWSKHASMATADRAEVDLELMPLLFQRQLRIRELRLTRPDVLLETGPDGKGNWIFKDRADDDSPLPLRRAWIDNGRLRYANAANKTEVDISVDSAAPQQPGASAPVDIKGDGRWVGNPFTIVGRAESPLELSQTDAPYRIDLKAKAGATEAHARGDLVNPFQWRRFDLQLELSGHDLEDLYALTGLAAPPTPPYRLDGRFSRQGQIWRYRDFSGVVGQSDLAGTAEFDVSGKRPRLTATLASKRLDLDDLAGFLGAPAEARQRASSSKLLPQRKYDLARLRAMDADVRLTAARINAPKLPFENMDAHLKLDAGVVRLAPLNFGVAGGNVRATIQMDARKDTIRTRADVNARGLELVQLVPVPARVKEAVGQVGGTIALNGSGNSIAAMLASSNGEVALGMGRGKISALLIEMAGLDVLGVLKYLIGGDQTMPVRCAFGDFKVQNGVMETRALAFDTQDTLIVGEGRINLRGETLDLVLRPRPKGRSILTLRAPLVVDGTFKDPSIRPDMARVGLRGAVALALGTIVPPAALLATIETGPGEDADCGGRYAK